MDRKKDAVPAVGMESAPDRSHCPPDDKVRAYANGEISEGHSIAEHLRQCSWCAREYRDHAKDLEWNRFINRSTKAFYFVLPVIVVVAALRSCH
jgi:hypothetical protein